MSYGLTIGAVNLPANEALVLRSLVKLLDGRQDLSVRFSDTPQSCNVIFVPGDGLTRLRGSCVSVRVISANTVVLPNVRVYGLSVVAPLRLSNVVEVLRVAAGLLNNANEPGLPGLFHVITRHLLSGERRATMLTLLDGRMLMVDFTKETLRTTIAPHELLAGEYSVAGATRASDVQIQEWQSCPPLRLREFLWAASHHLGENGVKGLPLTETYRMTRWPDASALARRGYPQLCAFLTSRAMSPQEAAEVSGLSEHTVCWFIEACLALSIAVPRAEAPSMPQVCAAPPPPPTRSILGRLRERLKLW